MSLHVVLALNDYILVAIALKSCTSLKVLNLSGSNIDSEGAVALADALNNIVLAMNNCNLMAMILVQVVV